MPEKNITPKAGPTPAEAHRLTGDEAGHSLTLYGQNPAELVFPKDMPEKDYLDYGMKLGAAMQYGAWRVGDYVNYGMQVYGYKDYEKIAAVTGLDEGYLRNCSSVAAKFNANFRLELSLEKARLMLGRKGDSESIPKLVKRLGRKTHAELKKMGASGGGGGGGGSTEITATRIYEGAKSLLDDLENFDSMAKLPALVAMEGDKDDGAVIKQLGAFLNALQQQLIDGGVKYPEIGQ